MARLFTSGFESGALTSEPDWSSSTGTIAIVGTQAHLGANSMQATNTAAGNDFITYRFAQSALPLGTTIYARAFFRLSQIPAANISIMSLIDSTFAGPCFVQANVNGALTVIDGGGNVVGVTAAAAITANTWFMVELAATVNTATTGYVEAKLNGVTFGLTNVGHNAAAGMRDLRVGVTSSTISGGNVFVDDVAVNDNSGSSNNTFVGAPPAAPATSTPLPAITGTPAPGNLLTCSAGTFTGSVVTTTYQWKRAGTPIPGMTAPQYMPIAADVGQTLTCDVTATNDGGSATETAPGVGPIAGAVPTRPLLAVADYRCVNYWPVNNSWEGLWATWDPASIDADMKRIVSINGNLVRCIINAEPTYFGYPSPNAGMMNRLEQFISIAAANGVSVYLTLFDTLASYTDFAGCTTWATAVLAPYTAADTRIAHVELKNEIDFTVSAQVTWATTMFPIVRALIPGVRTTVSTSDPTGAISTRWQTCHDAVDQYLDFYTLHLYNKLARAFGTMKACKAVVGAKNIFIGETGYSTDLSNTVVTDLTIGQSSFEWYQELWFRTFALNAAVLGFPKIAPWLLNDVTAASKPTGGVPALGQKYGIFRTDGSEKPAAAMFRAYFGSNAIDREVHGDAEINVETNMPAYWQTTNPTLATFARDATVFHSGAASFSIANALGNSGQRPGFYTIAPYPTEPGKRYQIEFWAMGNAVVNIAHGFIAWFDGTDAFISGPTINTPTGSFGWTHFTLESIAPPTSVYATFGVETYADTGQVWFDDIKFREVHESAGVVRI